MSVKDIHNPFCGFSRSKVEKCSKKNIYLISETCDRGNEWSTGEWKGPKSLSCTYRPFTQCTVTYIKCSGNGKRGTFPYPLSLWYKYESESPKEEEWEKMVDGEGEIKNPDWDDIKECKIEKDELSYEASKRILDRLDARLFREKYPLVEDKYRHKDN